MGAAFVFQSVIEILIAGLIILGFLFEDNLVRFERRLARRLFGRGKARRRPQSRALRMHTSDHTFRSV